MKPARIPPNEAERLAALHRSQLLDTLPELSFDDFARVASQLAGTPIALVTLVDAERQWFKARVGLETTETARDEAFCAHAILEADVFEVRDARGDDRFAENPLVTGDPHIRFYAGAQIRDDAGFALGTVCVIDRVPRQLDDAQRDALRSLARLVSAHIDLRRKSFELAELHRETVVKNRHVELMSELLDLANDMILVKDFSGKIVFWNRGAERTYGFPREEALGQLSFELLRTEYPKSRQAVIDHLLVHGHWEGELIHVKRDGTRIVVGSRWVLQRDSEGEPRAILELNNDITHKAEVQKLKDEFVSIVSHELRTPLTSIRGALGLLEGGVAGDLPSDAVELVTIARSNADRLIRLVNDILDLEKMEAGKLELQRRELVARAVLQSAVTSVATLAREALVTLNVDAAPDVRLIADEDRVTQLLVNLISNAIKFSPPQTSVTITARRRGPRAVRISVRDEGPGIPAEHLHKLFGKFQQLDASDKRRRGGTGLGLSICKAIAEQHGGSIGVDTRPGAGATFWVDLPAVAISSTRSLTHGPRRLVLLVDPQGVLSRSLGALLSEEGCVVARAGDLAEAERWLDSANPATVIVDMQLAGLAGDDPLGILQALAARFTPADAPTIVLTGRTTEDSRPAAALPVLWVADPLDEQRMKHVLRWGNRGEGVARVLLVEDDPGSRAVVAARLRHLGVEVLEASDGDSAVALVRDTAPDLIVLDIGLPGRDGFDIVAELRRERARSTPLIVYTARDLQHEERVELSLGITRWLTKSRTNDAEFLDSVRELLSGLLPP